MQEKLGSAQYVTSVMKKVELRKLQLEYVSIDFSTKAAMHFSEDGAPDPWEADHLPAEPGMATVLRIQDKQMNMWMCVHVCELLRA
uniref:WH1 domain-containing protein n=1 Tax=Angiostrongylus cantonensis TaxID=6313 RepID=A0A0K0DH04_ANGCA